MDFLKKNYEKIVLAVVLLGLVAAVGSLLIIVPQKRQKMEDLRTELTTPKVRPLPELDTKPEHAALDRLQGSQKLEFSGAHNLFNPVLWQSTAGGGLIKVDRTKPIGPEALKITAINPLYLKVTYVSTNASGFLVRIDRPTSPRPENTVVRPQGVGSVLTMKKLNGTVDEPVSLELQFKGESETFTLPADPGRPYSKVDGYTVDLKYPVSDRSLPKTEWKNIRATSRPPAPSSQIVLPDGTYWVIDVNENSATISSTANNKHTTIFLSRTRE